MNRENLMVSENKNGQKKLISTILMELILYIVLIPFLHPRGFNEVFSWYKSFFTLWMYLSLAIIVFIVLLFSIKYNIIFKKTILYVLIYYLLGLIITLFIQGGLSSGLQKMFAGPALCLFCYFWIQKYPASFLRVVSNILICIFFLNISLFNPERMLKYVSSSHINFIGHVQVTAPIGLLGLYFSFIMLKKYPIYKYRAIVLAILSIICMIISNTEASYYSLYIIFGALILSLIKPFRKLLCIDSRAFVVAFIVISVLLIFFQLQYHIFDLDSNTDLTFNGRTTIWNEAILLLRNHTFFGYGIQGITIQTYWGGAMNYAHNQLLQTLLDGGIVLSIAFYTMLLSYTSYVKKCHDQFVVFFTNTILIAYLFVMLFESVTEYFFVFFFLSLIVFLPDISNRSTTLISKGAPKKL